MTSLWSCRTVLLILLLLVVEFVRQSETQSTTVLTAVSGRISTTVTTVNDQFFWRIEPTVPVTNIQFIFENLNIQQAELRLYDTSLGSMGITIWNCVFCGVNIPPAFFSATGSVTIMIKAIKGVGFTNSGFTLLYIATPKSIVDLPSSISVNMNLGYNVLVPFSVNGQIPTTSSQRWIIRLLPGQTITFTFANFDLNIDCLDQMVIYDSIDTAGNVLFRGCKAADIPKQWFYSYTGNALIVFTTRNATTTSSFKLNYYSNTALFSCGSFFSSEDYVGESMILTDGSGPGLMRRGETCTWKITPTTAATTGTVTLIMSDVSLKFGGTLNVYDSADMSGFVLWNGVGATLTIPPIIRSTSNSLYVYYRSDTADPVRFTGFFGEYYTNYLGSVGSGRAFSTLSMSSEIDIYPPGNGILHTSGVNYTWFITPSIIMGKITFTFSMMNLLDTEDVVSLYDGTVRFGNETLLGRFTGSTIPSRWYTTSRSTATLVFQSKQRVPSLDYQGLFKVAYYSDGPNYHCGFTRNPASMKMASWIITDGSQSTESLYPNQFCTWNIEPDDTNGDVDGIYLYFTRYHIRGGSLTIFIGNVANNKIYTTITDSSSPPSPIYIPGKIVGLSYSTTSSAIGYGFSLTYYAVRSTKSFPGNDLVVLASSSLPSLKLHPSNDPYDVSSKAVATNTNLTWHINPTSATGRLYIALSASHFISNDCQQQRLEIYDGSSAVAPLLTTLCNNKLSLPYKWIVTSSTQAWLVFQSQRSQPTVGNFDLTYFTDGSNYHCGFHNNPNVMRAPSMVFSDGSTSTERMYANQNCEWFIAPALSQFNSAATSNLEEFVIVFEFLRCDLVGGSIEIYEVESNGQGEHLLWRCEDCQYLPKPILSSLKKLHVVFKTRSGANFGTGFTATYWIANVSDWRDTSSKSAVLLELPEKLVLNNAVDTTINSAKYYLAVDAKPLSLSYYPQYQLSTSSSGSIDSNDVIDGRPSSSTTFESTETPVFTCGIISSNSASHSTIGKHVLKDPAFEFTATQSASNFLVSRIDSKALSQVNGLLSTAGKAKSSSSVSAVEVCKYYLETTANQAIRITLASTTFPQNGRLRIYGGVYGNDSVVYDSNDAFQRSYLGNLTIPCGKSLIIIERNTSSNSSTASTPYIDYGFHLDYVQIPGDSGLICDMYIQSLLPPVKKEDPYIPYYIAAASLAIFILLVIFCMLLNKRKHKQGFYFCADDPSKNRRYTVVTPNHPRYNAKWDKFFNQFFLRTGQCCVCHTGHIKVLRLKCSHLICMEDTKGYLESALGDISMFPVKCPMHYEGCSGSIDANIAKRVLSESQYIKFLEFTDRCIYGDGMRCIYCNNYVNFPDQMTAHRSARVECPYCIQRFCIRCRKPWHINNKCPLDTYDDSIEVWKEEVGAQQCPSCKKLIEKDDPDTCHHMVHKITDGIPCIRDRTDFCYLCGEEVTGDYPHEEVQHPGVNHFPDGVFQKCRIIIQREKDAERERLRKVRRMKNNSNKQNPSPLMSPSGSVKKTAILPAEGLEWDDAYINAELALPVASPVVLRNNGSGLQTPYAQASPATPSRIVISGLLDQFDQFDQEWDLALAHVDTMASPARRTNTPNNNPNPNASYNNLRTALTQNQGNNNFSPNSYLPANGSPVNPLIATGRTFSSNASNGGGSSLQQRYAATSLQNSISSVQAVNTTGTSTPNFNNANVGIAGRNMNTNNNLSSAALNAMPGPGGTSSRQGSPQRFTRHSSANVIPTPSNTR